MDLPDRRASVTQGPWISLWVVALVSLLAQLGLCQFFSFGDRVPISIDINPCNLWKVAYHFPPTGTFQVLNWLGIPYFPQTLQPLSLASALLSTWWFFTCYAPIVATFSLLAMAAFLRELELSRPAAIFGGVIYAWQGDILPFVYPGHFSYMATWPFFALAAWGALRSERTGQWAYALISGAACGLMVGLPTNADRGSIASILIGVLYLAAIFRGLPTRRTWADHLAAFLPLLLCVAIAALVALAPLLALYKGNIENVKIAGVTDREQTFKLVTQFSLGPWESLTYLAPGFFGWHMNNPTGPYWGWIGEWPDWPEHHQGTRNLNLAISTTGTVATLLALIGALLLVGKGLVGPAHVTTRQRFFGRVLLAAGLVALILSWGWHTPLYHPLFALPLMDKWRNPLKWLEMTNFALVALSAIGLQHLIASLESAAPETGVLRRRLIWLTHGAAILLGLALLLSFPLGLFLGTRLQADGFDPSLIGSMLSTMHNSLLYAWVLVVLLCLILRGLWKPQALRNWTFGVNPLVQRIWLRMLEPEYLPLTLGLALALLAAVQLGWVATQFIQPAPLEALTMSNPLLEALRGEGDTVRVSVAVQDPVLNQLVQNQFAAMNISCLDISAASRIPNDLNAFFGSLENDEARLWLLAGVKNVVVPEAGLGQMREDTNVAPNIDHADGYTLEQTASPDLPSHALVGMKDYLAKATFVPGVEFLPSDEAMLKRLRDPAWNPRESILLERPAEVSVPPSLTATGAPKGVVLKSYTPQEINLEAQTTRSGFVLINDQFDPDWEVTVNGRKVPLLRADYILRAVAIPEGRSEIALHYVAHYKLAGTKPTAEAMTLLSDGIMLGAWLIAGISIWRQRRQP